LLSFPSKPNRNSRFRQQEGKERLNSTGYPQIQWPACVEKLQILQKGFLKGKKTLKISPYRTISVKTMWNSDSRKGVMGTGKLNQNHITNHKIVKKYQNS